MTRILIVRLGALGDIVHALPAVAALRRAFPDARIDWLVGARHREILDLVPVVNRRVVMGDGLSFVETIRELRRARYEMAIDLQGLLKSAVLARTSGAPRVVGFTRRYLREKAARFFYTEAYEPAAPAHIARQNLALVEALGVEARGLEFPLDPVESAVARQVAERAGGRYAILNPGAAWPNKRWPPSRLGEVAAALRDRHGLASVVIWGPGEQTLAEEAVAASRGAAFVSPRTTVSDLVALARGAAVMLSGDTGPAHIAAAVGTPIVGIFGPTRPQRNGPWSPADVTVSRDAICQCHHLRRCKLPRMCLLDIEVPEVVSAIDRRLGSEKPSHG